MLRSSVAEVSQVASEAKVLSITKLALRRLLGSCSSRSQPLCHGAKAMKEPMVTTSAAERKERRQESLDMASRATRSARRRRLGIW